MRTTLTLDDDLAGLLRQRARELGEGVARGRMTE
jgi:hypothetical protein